MIVVWSNAPPKAVAATVGHTLDARGAKYRLARSPAGLKGLTPDDVILAMGTQALARLKEWGVCPKVGGLGNQRGKVRRRPDGEGPAVLVTWDPGILNVQEKSRSELVWDANLAWRLDETGTVEPQVGVYQWVEDLDELITQVGVKWAATHKPVPVTLDLEMMGFFPYYPDRHILTSQWTVEPGESWLVDHRLDDGTPTGKPTDYLDDVMRHQIEWLLTSDKVFLGMTNGKGDQQWIQERWGIHCTNFGFDTVLAGSLVNENRHNSLNAQTKEYAPELGGYDDSFNSHFDKGHLEDMPRYDPQFTVYAGGDSDATMRVSGPIMAELRKDPRLLQLYRKLTHPAARCFERIERRGILVDIPKAMELRTKVMEYRKAKTTEAMAMIPIPLRAKYSDNLSLTRPRLIVDYLFTPDGLGLTPKNDGYAGKAKPHRDDMPWFNEDGHPRMPSTSVKDHLGRFRDTEAGPFIQILEDLTKANKTLSTYLLNEKGDRGFLTHVRPDGRLHPTYALAVGALYDDDDDGGTNTGRLSAKGPAWQTLPKHTMWARGLRACYPAPEGYLCWEMDFSQGELRVFACVANELAMIAAYKKGMDLHGITAAMANHIDVDEFLSWKYLPEEHPNHKRWKELRQGGKAGNFGLLYRMKAPGFQQYAWKQYGVVMSLEEAEAFRNLWFQTWARVGPWHEEVLEAANRDLMVRSPMGRVRHLPMLRSQDGRTRSKAERQAINSPIQGTLSDLNLWAILGMEEAFGDHEKDFCVLGTIHDQMHGYVRAGAGWEQRIADAHGAVTLQMSRVREVFQWDHQLEFPVDVGVGPNLAEMEELDMETLDTTGH